MLLFILKRIGVAIPTLLVLIIFSFILMHSAPGGPFTSERALPPQVLHNINVKYGLDKPLWEQVGTYVWNIVTHFDFGPSFRYKDRTVNDIIAQGFPITLTYGAWSFVIAVLVGVSLGITAAVRQNSFLDYLAVGVSIGAQVLPNFVMSPILLIVFTLWLRWLPGGGWDWSWPTMVMPIIALSTSFMASIARLTRSSMLEVLHSNFIRTAKAKGLPEHTIIFRHALKPALVPVVSYLGPTFVVMISGSLIIDMFFSTGGIGWMFVNAALNRDYSTIMGITILIGALTITFNGLVDVLYAWLDPRVRY